MNDSLTDLQQTLLTALQQPASLTELPLSVWDRLLPLARQTGVLGRLAELAAVQDLTPQLPPQIHWHLHAARIFAAHNQQTIAWELNRLSKELAEPAVPLILLKGAAYLAAGLPPALGRSSSDVDLLARPADLSAVESRLKSAGYQQKDIPGRDAKYFRQWLHEVPPLAHDYRCTDVDLHHNILPGTDKLQFDTAALFQAAVPAGPDSRFLMLAPVDMVLHSAIHLFRNGDFTHGLRDLTDLDVLLRHFDAAAFWPALADRVQQLQLTQPVWLALRYVQAWLGTPLPDAFQSQVQTWQPAATLVRTFDRCVRRAVFPDGLADDDSRRRRALWLLAHYPVPRLKALLTPLFWLKRFPTHAITH